MGFVQLIINHANFITFTRFRHYHIGVLSGIMELYIARDTSANRDKNLSHL